MSLEHGAVIKLVNKDTMAHSVTSVAVDKEGDPLFDVVVAAGRTGTLVVPATLAAGKYPFYCSFHPNMQGTLVVTGKGGDAPEPPKFEQALRIPEVLTGSKINIRMKQAEVRIMPTGPRTTMWTYGGIFPGPTIKRPTGSTTKVTFVNDLPKGTGSMTVHQHGGHQSSEDDGQPTRFLIERGARRTYTYPLTDAGEPMPAAFRFYHDHRMGLTARNNWYGLQGMFSVTDPAAMPPPARRVRHPAAPDRSQPRRRQPVDGHVPRPAHARLADRGARTAERRDGRQADPRQRPVRAVPHRPTREVPTPAAERLHVLGLQPRALERPSARPGRHRERPAPRKVERSDILRPGPAGRRRRRLLRAARQERAAVHRPARRRLPAPAPGRRRSCSSGCGTRTRARRCRTSCAPCPPLDVPDEVAKVWTSA